MSIPETNEFDTIEGIIFDIQRYSVHDGPGIRTNVFFKGCPLRCAWCANPESQHMHPELAIFAGNCMNCGQFTPSCPLLRSHHKTDSLTPDLDETYKTRVDLCPVEAIRWVGQMRTASAIIQEVYRDLPFYGENGGLTLTGGEPTLQPHLAEALLKSAKAIPISTAMETCGHTAWPVFERLLPYLDLILFDLKHIDPDIHRRFTGVSNDLILTNLRKLVALGTPITLRVPLIPGFNANEASLAAMGRFILKELDGAICGLDLLPYHTLGKSKYEPLGRAYPWAAYPRLTDAEVEALADVIHSFGFKVTIGG